MGEMLLGQLHGGGDMKILEKVGIRKVQGGLDYLHVHVILGKSKIKIPSIVVELIDLGVARGIIYCRVTTT